jgi:NAD(P)H-dependent FMN reductase
VTCRLPLVEVITGSTRPGRRGAAVAEWITGLAQSRPAFTIESVDLARVNLPFLDELEQPKLGLYSHAHTKAWSALVSRAQGFLFVIPEYNHGYNAATKNAIDFLFREWDGKPVGFVTYGGRSGGARAAEQLGQVVETVGMIPIPSAVAVVNVEERVSNGRFASDPRLDSAAQALLDSLEAALSTTVGGSGLEGTMSVSL